MKVSALVTALFVTGGSTALAEPNWHRTPTGIAVTPRLGSEAALRLEVYGGGIIRVTSGPTRSLNLPASLMVTAKPVTNDFTVAAEPGFVTLMTAKASARVDLNTGNVAFRDASGRSVLAESSAPVFTPVAAEGVPFLTVTQQFNRGTDEGFYGLGQHQNRQMNYNGEDVDLAQHNMVVAIPFVVSTRNYGLLWDQTSVTHFGDPKPYAYAGAPGDGLTVTGNAGQPGWTASYTVNGKTVANRQEPAIDLQYLEDVSKWPVGTRTPNLQSTVPGLHVTWTGTITPANGGLHRFRLYASSYFRLSSMARKC